MKEHAYLKWMAENTESMWCNDSALDEDIFSAIAGKACGCTTNPPLSFEALTKNPETYRDEVDRIPPNIRGNDRNVELIGAVLRHISKIFHGMYEETSGRDGYVRTQVEPRLSSDANAMLEMGKKLSSWGDNVMVKIPGTNAGVWVLEELASMGIPTTPTVCVSVSQIIAVAEAYERGIKRAKKAGITPKPSTAAIVMGRLQDYLSELNLTRDLGLSVYDLENAALAVAKRCCSIISERGFRQVLMPAAFRSERQFAGMVGGKVVMTIHPKIQDMIIQADKNGSLQRKNMINDPVDPDSIERVSKTIPEFDLAYRPGAMSGDDFDRFGGTIKTLHGFDVTGWQMLLTL